MKKDEPGAYASPACMMHEVDPTYMGLEPPWESVNLWRRAERRRLIDVRKVIPADQREQKSARIVSHLDHLLRSSLSGKDVSVYWPFLGEPDLRGWMATIVSFEANCLLPVVEEKGKPLKFRTWASGEPLERGVLNIPVPAHGKEKQPSIIIAPVVGFDAQCYRLGIGGGYFDRTLAAMSPQPLAIGVGFALQEIPSIQPQPHDIPMDVIITDSGIRIRSDRSKAIASFGLEV